MSKAASNKLLQDITGMMTDPSQATNENKINDIMNRIRCLEINKATEEVRLAACHVGIVLLYPFYLFFCLKFLDILIIY